MDLSHSFTVPASVADTWRTFEDIESVAECFPGATVTEVDGNDFKGTCKVKLGPIALVYSGTGTFVEKDESARRFVIEAKGKDKRGNGTAGATVTAVFAEEGTGSTKVDVSTDLAITGKPAQFGRGMIEDISNKLLQQFVTCLQDKVGAVDAATDTDAAAAEDPVAPPPTGSDPAQSASGDESSRGEVVGLRTTSAATSYAGKASGGTPSKSSGPEDDALDLGATVLPILARTYGPQAAIALVTLVIGYLLGRRSSS